MSEEKSIRSFLAVDPPREIIDAIGMIQDRLRKNIQGYIRWVRPQGIHLTLKFFGAISESDVANISLVAENTTSNISPFTLGIKRVGAFPDVKRPRVLWLGMDGDVDTLIRLQKEVDAELQKYGFEKEDRTFRPHLTLARIKDPRGLIGLAKIMEKRENYEAGSFSAAGLNLFKSDLTPKGAVYTKLAYFPFGG
ncbi:MAG: RNA 2',3'-cyclic phosphodiesterase [Deltaproteobacteria bacterium]|nr:RNA 2',3'-cyclic phosphodiesterase [Deltaproteobacteria bacterium]